MVGSTVAVAVLEADEAGGRLILSERAALWARRLRAVREADVFDGRVNAVADFGAFVDLRFPDGSFPLSGLVHVSEISWDPVRDARDVLHQGQAVSVKVIQVDRCARPPTSTACGQVPAGHGRGPDSSSMVACIALARSVSVRGREKKRLALSIKQLQADPLLETLDTLMPVATLANVTSERSREEAQAIGDAELLQIPLPGLDAICKELLNEPGILSVVQGRQALEQRVVSQDLELWLSNAPAEDGRYTLLARAGRQVQEVQVSTTLDREGMKAAVQRVTMRVL
eukprot:SM000043S15877  [mRNA]  locus=s43:745878:747456:+ [translate_table: standard]